MKTRLLILSLFLTTCGIVASLPLYAVPHQKVATDLNVDRQLEYCNLQIHRALNKLRRKDGSYNFDMEPRNILGRDRQKGWNCRPATAEEW